MLGVAIDWELNEEEFQQVPIEQMQAVIDGFGNDASHSNDDRKPVRQVLEFKKAELAS